MIRKCLFATAAAVATTARRSLVYSGHPQTFMCPPPSAVELGTLGKQSPLDKPIRKQLDMNLLQEAEFYANLYPSTIQFMQCGGFYELYDISGHDLDELSIALGLSIAEKRSKDSVLRRFCGFPTGQISSYLKKATGNGYTVVVIDQIGSLIGNRTKLKKRGVTRVVSPGTIFDESAFNNFILSVVIMESTDQIAIAWADVGTGEFYVSDSSIEAFVSDFVRISPKEVLIEERLRDSDHPILKSLISRANASTITWQTKSIFDLTSGRKRLNRLLLKCQELPSLLLKEDMTFNVAMELALSAVLNYLFRSFNGLEDVIRFPIRVYPSQVLQIDMPVYKALELSQTLYEGKRKGSVIQTLDHAVTAQESPSTHIPEINRRLDLISAFIDHPDLANGIISRLRKCADLERTMQKLHLSTAGPIDLLAIHNTFIEIAEIKTMILQYLCNVRASRKSAALPYQDNEMLELKKIADRVQFNPKILAIGDGLISIDAASSKKITAFGTIVTGRFDNLDGLLERREDLNLQMLNMEAELKLLYCCRIELKTIRGEGAVAEFRGKIGSSIQAAIKEDSRFASKGKIANPWTDLHADMTNLDEKLVMCENEIFLGKCKEMLQHAWKSAQISLCIAELDVALCCAKFARENNHIRPIVVEEAIYDIKDGRHPVVEFIQKAKPGGQFVGNDCKIGGQTLVWLITGPNMGGKSTFLRQCALMSIMAQAGFYVPATRATLGIVDRILSRMGTSDNLTADQSSFMLEMMETASIIKNASPRSLILLDEVGRGTSPSEAIALSFGLLSHINNKLSCRTLFATHFTKIYSHVLEAREMFAANFLIQNFIETPTPLTRNDLPIYKYVLTPGVAEGSHGLLVAQMAGVPAEIIAIAKGILNR